MNALWHPGTIFATGCGPGDPHDENDYPELGRAALSAAALVPIFLELARRLELVAEDGEVGNLGGPDDVRRRTQRLVGEAFIRTRGLLTDTAKSDV